MAKTTAIRAPTTDPINHQIVLRQLKEASETASRLRGNARDSFAQVGELLDAGIVRFVDGKLVAPSPSSLPPTVVPSTRQIKTGGSIQGGGALSADLSLELVGDAGSPGNSMLYGTNATGVKGWYTQPAAATTLASLADVSISGLTNGQVLAYNSAAAKWENQTISSGGGSSGGGSSNWTPDSHPTNPDTTNDEFESSSLSSQWTWVNKGAALAKLNQGYAYFIGDSATPYSFIGQVTPGSSWKYRAKMMFEVGYASYAFGGISIWNASSGKNYIFGPSQAANGRAVYSFTSQAGAGYSQVSSDTSYGGPTAFVYYEIQCDGTNLYFRVSESGEDDSFHQVYTATLASFIGSVDHIGIAINQYVTPVGMIVDWFRRVDTGVTPSASGGAPFLNVDSHPTNPTAYDDEFEESSLSSKWTRVGAAGPTAVLSNGSLLFTADAGGNQAMLLQSVPAAPWTFTIKMTTINLVPAGAVVLYNSGNNKFIPLVVPYQGTAPAAATSPQIIWTHDTYNGLNTTPTYVSTIYNTTFTDFTSFDWTYYQLSFDGTNIKLYWSKTGLPGSFFLLSTEALSTWLGAITGIGFTVWNANATIAVDWIRRTA